MARELKRPKKNGGKNLKNNMLDQAINYIRKKKSIIPLKKDKRPYLTEWREFQVRIATEQEVLGWWQKWPEANIGLVTGKISGITVIDVDVEHGGKTDGLPPTLVARTGNGGWHYYYQYEPGVTIGAGLRQGIDFRGDGGYVVAPPSVTDYLDKQGNKKGGKYEFVLLEEMVAFPQDLFNLQKSKPDWKKVMQGVGEGVRNMTTASLAGKLLASFKKPEWETLAWPMLQLWNKNNIPPDDEKIVRRTFESMMKKHILGQPEEKTEEIKIVHLSEAAAQQEDAEKKPIGIASLDEAMQGGISIGSSVVLAAPSGEGKTAFMVSISYHFIKNNTTCLWFSYEETARDIWKRFEETGIEKEPVFCPLNLADNKLDFIEEVIKIQKQKTNFFVVFIDQLSFLAPKVPNKADINHIQGNYAMYLGMISQQLKNMAMEYGIIIVFAHQLGRTGDVAYSDMIKHAPDKVIYLKREPANSESEDEFTDKTFVTFKKNRPFGTRPRLVMTVKDGLFIPYNNPNPMVQFTKKIMGAREVNKFNFDDNV